MVDYDPKGDLWRYLTQLRGALVWKLEGLSDYDVRRPLTPTGTNLLGLVKHLTSVEAGYLGDTFGRPYPEAFPWDAPGAEEGDDMWATPQESRDDLIAGYRRVWAHTEATVEALPLDAVGRVAHWPAPHDEVTLHRILVHVVTEIARHAGQADIVRETIDGAVGHRADSDNMAPGDAATWAAYVAKLQAAADQFAD